MERKMICRSTRNGDRPRAKPMVIHDLGNLVLPGESKDDTIPKNKSLGLYDANPRDVIVRTWLDFFYKYNRTLPLDFDSFVQDLGLVITKYDDCIVCKKAERILEITYDNLISFQPMPIIYVSNQNEITTLDLQSLLDGNNKEFTRKDKFNIEHYGDGWVPLKPEEPVLTYIRIKIPCSSGTWAL